MRILIFPNYYPTPENYANSRFIHERVIEYAKIENVQVLVAKIMTKDGKPSEYIHEGIKVKIIRTDSIKHLIDQYQPDIICIHFFDGRLLDLLIPYAKVPILVWVHGVEALGWYRRLFDFHLSIPFLKSIVRNIIQLWRFGKLIRISNETGSIAFIFVSNWMRKVTEIDTLSKTKHYSIIPNPIDTHLFEYKEKNQDMRKNILIIRSFESKKYANDLAIKALLYLSSRPIFKELSIEIFGDGQYFQQLTQPLEKFPNIKLHRRFVEHHLIPELHHRHGIFLCPTRQDSQGVSMCEAMASGLVPIASDNTAIPEFIQDNYSGFLTTSYLEIADKIVFLYENPDIFSEMSANAASIVNICGKPAIINREIGIMRDIIAGKL